MINKFKNRKIIIGVLVFFILIFSEYFFFRNIIGTNKLFSDRGDGRLTMLLTEHWFNFFKGKEKFGELAMFYPATNVLAYSDMFLFFGIIHSCFRFIGLDMFNAYKYTLILVHFIGTLSMYYLLSKKLKLNITWSLFGTFAFSFSSTYATHLGHTQLCACSMLPLLLIFIINFFENLEERRKKNIYAFLTITWYLFILYNSWYIAFFTFVFVLMFILVYLIGLIIQRKNPLKMFFNLIGKIGVEILIYLLYVGLSLIPFVKLYLPVLKRNTHNFSSVGSVYIPEVIDLINVGENNWLLGNFIRYLKLSNRSIGEADMGFSFVLFTTFIIFSMFYIRKRKKVISKDIIFYSIITVFIGILFTIKISSNPISLWYFIYKLVPGASSVRAISRYLLYLTFPMAVLTAFMGNLIFKIYNFKSNYYKKYIPIYLFLLLCISNIRNEGIFSTWNRKSEKEYLSNVSKPNNKCKVFYVSNTNPEIPEYIYQLDAYEIANKYSIKTINGYSGNTPDKWEGIWEVSNDEYEGSVISWIILNNLKNVCRYDIKNNKWFEYNNSILEAQSYTNGAMRENGKIKIPKDGVLFGPYLTLSPGKYRVEFTNKIPLNSNGLFSVSKNRGVGDTKIKNISSNKEKVNIEFELLTETKDIEFTVLNNTSKTFWVENIKLYKVQ